MLVAPDVAEDAVLEAAEGAVEEAEAREEAEEFEEEEEEEDDKAAADEEAGCRTKDAAVARLRGDGGRAAPDDREEEGAIQDWAELGMELRKAEARVGVEGRTVEWTCDPDPDDRTRADEGRSEGMARARNGQT